jgi:hypothetical protein
MPSQQASHTICKARSGLGWLDMLTGNKSPKLDAYNKCMAKFGFAGGRSTRKNKSKSKARTTRYRR